MRNVFVLLCLALGGCCFFPFLGAQSLTKHAVAKPTPIAAPDPWEPAASQPPAFPSQPPFPSQPTHGHVPVARPAGHLNQQSFTALTTGAVPQAPDPRGLFDRAARVQADHVQGGLIACRVRLTRGGYDDSLFAGGADVYMHLRLGQGPQRTSPHRSARVFTFPVEDLERGDALSVTVMDRDVFFHDRIGGGRADYTGGETVIHASPGAEVRCRPIAPATVDRARSRALRQVSRAIDRLDRAAPELEAYDFAYPGDRTTAVLDATREALAFMMLSDPELEAQVDRAVEFDDRWEERVQAAVDEASQTLSEPGAPARVPRLGTLHVDSYACGRAAATEREQIGEALVGSGCVLRLGWIPSRTGPVQPSDFEVWGIDGDGGMPTATVEAIETSEGVWTGFDAAPQAHRGQATSLALSFAPGTRPRLLRVRGPGRAVLLRLE